MENICLDGILSTERLILRPFKKGDEVAMFKNWASDLEVVKYLRYKPHEDINTSREIIKKFVKNHGKEDWYFAICLKGSDEAIGCISLHTFSKLDFVGDIGYNIARRFWNKGYMTEALKAVIKFAFVMTDFNRVEASHAVLNPASGEVMKKAGMKFEGVCRESYKAYSLGFLDASLYAILRKDYILN